MDHHKYPKILKRTDLAIVIHLRHSGNYGLIRLETKKHDVE